MVQALKIFDKMLERPSETTRTGKARSAWKVSKGSLRKDGAGTQASESNQNKCVKNIRIATLNIGTLTSKSNELSAVLKDRRIDICALQETRWSGAKSHNIGNGFKVMYNGSPRTQNGVGIAISKQLSDVVAEVHRYDDRLMKIIIITVKHHIHFFCAYAPQTGCIDHDKDAFWNLLDEKVAEVPSNHYLIIAGDLNGHVGKSSDGYSCHGGKGSGRRNKDGERILEFADAHNLIITNTWFQKRQSHLETYYSGSTASQIDFILVKRHDLKTVLDAKAIPYETIAAQHRPLICRLHIKPPKEIKELRNGPSRIKWWKLRENEAEVITSIKLPLITTVEKTWNLMQQTISKAVCKKLGTTKPGRRMIDKQTWLWTDEVKSKVREKKQLYHAFLANKTSINWQKYRDARNTAKKVIAAVKAAHYEELYKKLDTRQGEREIYRLARSRHEDTKDIEKFYGVNDENGQLISDSKNITERWKKHFEKISSEEFPHQPIPYISPIHGPIQQITIEEVTEVLKKIKCGKVTGPDDLTAEIWKSQYWDGSGWLTNFFNQVIQEMKIPNDWQHSLTIPIWKQKGNPAECFNYRPIRLLSHTMKVFERIIDRRIREIVKISVNQTGFVKNCGTIDAIHATRLLLEKHQEKQKALHIAFLDLEKAFDSIPHDVIWYALRHHNIPENLINCVKLLYKGSKSNVRTTAGISKDFNISVGVHQGSALSPLLFILAIDAITFDLQLPIPWTIIYADDVMIASENKLNLEQQVQSWSNRLTDFGLKLNVKKTEYLTTDVNEFGTIKINGIDLPRTESFKYLGSVITSGDGLIQEINARVNATWLKWRSVTGVICDKKISDRLKSKIYRTVIRPVALYGAECWPTTKQMEHRLCSMETKMLRWISGITRYDHICNDDIRQRYGVVPIADKLRESRLRWYGHVLRADNRSLAKIGLLLEVDGKRSKGRPRQRWLDTLHNDLKIAGIHPDQAHDRAKWRERTSKADLMNKWDKR